jgi:hypothetical protein
MVRLQSLLCCALVAALLAGGCSTKRAAVDELGATEAPLPDSLAAYSSPLDLREFDVAEAEGGQRGVFLRLSRLPTGVTASSQSDPPRIIVDIQGPTGSESAEEVFPAGDTLVTHIAVTRRPGGCASSSTCRAAARRSSPSTRWPIGSWCGSSPRLRARGRGRTGRVEGWPPGL